MRQHNRLVVHFVAKTAIAAPLGARRFKLAARLLRRFGVSMRWFACLIPALMVLSLNPGAHTPIWAAGAATAARSLPQRNLLVSWRMQSDAQASRDSRGLQGGVVVDTQGGMRGQGVVTWGSQQAQASGQGEMQVLVLNGGQARLSLGQQRPYTQWQWLAGLHAPTSASSPGSPSLQVLSSTTWVDTGQGLRVKPSWGGGKSVTLELETQADVSHAGRGLISGGAESLPPERVQAQTTLQVPLDQWVTVARTQAQESRSQQGSWRTSEVAQDGQTLLQVKVSVP
jgi:hypothetical protein